MSRTKRKAASLRRAAPVKTAGRAAAPGWWPFAALVLAIVIFYWTALTSPSASIQWDAVDVHYSAQKYFADHLLAGRLPFWTRYVHSGFPFLADPQVGAWYPLNWPLFLAGVTPKAIEIELALHALLAAVGAYLLGRFLLGERTAALGAALFYSLNGFFAGHSSHVGMFQGAAWLPWLLLAFLKSLEGPGLRYALLAGVVESMIVLAGHFQTALYAGAALGIVAVVETVRNRARWRRTAVSLGVATLTAALLPAILVLPGLELTGESIRAGFSTATSSDGALDLRALGTLVYPNLFGVFSGGYRGPGDATQYYFYSGILLLPLAAFGLKDHRVRAAGAALFVLAMWYALGPIGGLYRIIGMLPGFGSVRAPVHDWFVAALGLALLGGAGLSAIAAKWRHRAVVPLLPAVLFIDLFYWNSAANPLAYARYSFEDLYGRNERTLAQVAQTQPPLTRFMASDKMPALGPMNGPLDVRLEATYGYNPLELRAYGEYRAAAAANPKLVDGLNVSRKINLQTGVVDDHPAGLPRAYFPRSVRFAASWDESRGMLASLAPPETAVVLSPAFALPQDASAEATVVAHDDDGMRIRCRAASESLLRVAVPFYPGWEAGSQGRALRVFRADHAFIGVLVPAGEREITLSFGSRYFLPGAAISLAAAAAVIVLLVTRGAARSPDRPG